MNKTEILNSLMLSGEIHKKTKSETWIIAFELYKKSTGDYQIGMDCGSCFAKVLKWLQS